MVSFYTALAAGAVAGTTVDLSLFPLDTLKTRLQSAEGFFASGGFRGVYRGIGSAVVGSSPGAALFFCTYETAKSAVSAHLQRHMSASPAVQAAATHMAAASLGEVAACAVRVPTEVVKQRAQAGQHGGSSRAALSAILAQGSLPRVWAALYRGWGITVMREVPFTVIQFPLWEALKRMGRSRRAMAAGNDQSLVGVDVPALESAAYGSLAGGVAAAATTPLDVLKTRTMLAKEKISVAKVLKQTYREGGVRVFFSGIGPRVMWISIGGAIFLGSYQSVVNTLVSPRGEKSR
ncbi:putative mitochondrial carrier C12B10.09 [Ceratocystis fimbriata CBS 114723]|uniref:Putative mitochondrial carrier C12B10.09 n=1 Tax=Ceratocystis fimbriata CBS 114723 TaxID=1035309 RepID=A0A2C5XCR0_9PEZI|nr:putative mitochondrial carrier C12B10.09 [Ceratocystis fimbriata CBS 114723]